MSIETQIIQLPFTTSHAFIVGINAYEHLTPLSTAVNDARVIAENLKNQHGFTVHEPMLNATHEDLCKLLKEEIPRLVGEDDRVLFYFAGHGIALDGEEGPNGYLVAADTRPGQEDTLIPMQTLHDALTGLPCRHGLLVLDCCFSGAFKWSSGYRDVIFDLPKVIYEERFWRYCKDPAWQVITSSAHDQKAVDIITNQSLGLREEQNGKHSPFAASLLRALEGEGDMIPAGGGDGVMTATELYSYLRDSVETQTTENAKRQSPSLFNLQRHGKGEFIFLNPNHRFNLPPTPDRNPFLGLSSYDEDDASLFYGRDRVVETLHRKVASQPLTVVSGASGTGKSSVIKAGVLPQLRKEGYTILPIIRPGKEPLKTLITELPDIKEQVETGPTVLVVDQYEELITQCLKEEDRLAFEQKLAGWLKQYPELRIMLSIRSDFEPQFESEALAEWWQLGRYVVPVFSLEEIREVITKPAAQAVLFYEPEDLVEQLSEEVSQAPGALPLLSFTLSELYHAYLKSGREDRALTEEDYNQLGGVIGALRTRADAEYKALNPKEQSSMRKLMLRMVSLEGGELAGKRVYAEELKFKNSTETKRLQTIANRLVDARLLLKGTDGQGRNYVEPAHDALVRAWARLWEWIKTVGEEKITLQYKLSQAVNDYHELLTSAPKKARNLLWNSNPRLDILKAELEGKDHGLNAQEEVFVETSIKRRAARKRTNWTIAIAVMLGLAGLAWIANTQRISAVANEQLAEQKTEEVRDSAQVAASERSRANQEARKAISNNLASQSALMRVTDPTFAFRLAEVSLQYDSGSKLGKGALLSAFYKTIMDHQTGLFYRKVNDMPFKLPDNKRINEDRLPGYPVPPKSENSLRRPMPVSAFYSPGKRYLFETNDDHPGPFFLEMASLSRGQWSLRTLLETDCLFASKSFSPNERYFIIPDRNALSIVSPEAIDETLFSLYAPQSVRQAYFADNGKKVFAQTFDNRYYEFNLTGYEIPVLSNRNTIYAAYYAPDGKTMVLVHSPLSDSEGEVSVWVNENGWKLRSKRPGRLSKNKNAVSQEGFPTLAITNYGYFIESDDGNPDQAIHNLPNANEYSVTFPANRRSITIQDARNASRKVELLGHMLPIESITVSPDGKSILTSSNQEVKLWDWTGNNYFSLSKGGHSGFLPDGNSIFLTPWSPEEEEGYFEGRTEMEIYTLDTRKLLQWADAQGVYKLSRADKLKYGVN